MALPLGKLTILVGAGIVGLVLAKEGRMPSFSDLFSGAVKIASSIRRENPFQPVSKPRNDSLIDGVNILRQELLLLSSNRQTSGTGTTKYGVVIILVVVGYGYIWWKGWKLPDMMSATKRSLSDACDSVGLILNDVYESFRSTWRHL